MQLVASTMSDKIELYNTSRLEPSTRVTPWVHHSLRSLGGERLPGYLVATDSDILMMSGHPFFSGAWRVSERTEVGALDGRVSHR